MRDRYDAIIAGGGHAGCEAASALARLGHRVLLITSNVDRIGYLSCNPSLGGVAKGHMVREIDALGGMMGLWADEATIQSRTLNTRKGPAVQATRVQLDRATYLAAVQRDLFALPTLHIRQDTLTGLEVRESSGTRRICGVRTALGEVHAADHVILTTGTFLDGRMHIGLSSFGGGRLGDAPACGLSEDLRALGIKLGRLKTGTTPRLLASSIDYARTEVQAGDPYPVPFSFHSDGIRMEQVPCHLTWTNEATHAAIRSGFDRSPMFTGVIEGTGARYCPSIEDKVARFPEKERHQVFLEPEGLHHPEVYPSGIPTSLPFEVQKAMIASMVGLENAHIVRPGYAIEYDFIPPMHLTPELETKVMQGLWSAGQINGTSGYEEAAIQGLVAALNVHARLSDLPTVVLGREQAYGGVLIDDLVTKGTLEPYRMFTSRAEHRLLLREGNADTRLTPFGREVGLVDDAHWQRYTAKRTAMAELTAELEGRTIRPDAPTRETLTAMGATIPGKALTLAELLRQPAVTLPALALFWEGVANYPDDVVREVQTVVKYAGYLRRQDELVARAAEHESILLPDALDYADVAGLTREAVEKLATVRPRTLAQAARISGVTPAAIGAIEIHLRKTGVR